MNFETGDLVYLKVTPLRGSKKSELKGKLTARYIGPFPITAQRGQVAYELDLSEDMEEIHSVFHMSQLKKHLRVPEELAPRGVIELSRDLTYPEFSGKILHKTERTTRAKMTRQSKV